MEQLVQAFSEFAMSQPWASYFIGFCLLCRIFVTVAPTSLTEKLPDFVMVIINTLALSSNKVTDNKGNKIK